MLVLASLTLAGTHAYTFGGTNEDYTTSDAQGNCFAVTTTVNLSTVSVDVMKDSSATSSTFYFYVWEEVRSGVWDAVDSVNASYTSTSGFGWVTGTLNYTMGAGSSYCIGIYSTQNLKVEHGSTSAGTTPEWARALTDFGFTGGDAPYTLEFNPGTGPDNDMAMELEIVATDGDRDGHDVLTDCDDTDADVNPDATEVWYDGVDQDCDGASDYDQDGDGYDQGDDCDDTEGTTHPGAQDRWYDGVDADCRGDSDYDKDGDGEDSADYGGTDCNDAQASVNTGAEEEWYDGVDQDCSGTSDYDQDGDGHDAQSAGGDDCDDRDASVARDCSGGGGTDTTPTGEDPPTGGGGGGSADDGEKGGCLCTTAGFGTVGYLGWFVAAALLGRRRR